MASPAPALQPIRAIKPAAKAEGAAVAAAAPERKVIASAPGILSSRAAMPPNPSEIPVHAGRAGEKQFQALDTQLPLLLQCKLAVGSSNDPLEAEADRTAAQVVDGSTPQGLGPVAAQPVLRRAPGQSVAAVAAPPHVDRLLRSTGQPLDPQTRAFMEPRFGWDFADVRIHSGPEAAASAAALGARAYAAGHDIVFGKGMPPLHSQAGRQLLAHELTHVTQQAQGRGSGMIRRTPEDPQKDAQPTLLETPYKLTVTHTMSPETVLRAVIKGFFNLKTDAEVDKYLKHWHIDADAAVTDADVDAGYKMLLIKQGAGAYMARLSKTEKAAVNKEVDRRFWESTHYKPGQKLGHSAEDQEKAKEWMKIREGVLLEDSQRKQIDALAPNIRKFLFDEQASATVEPKDFQTVLRLANKLKGLTQAELDEYKSRVTGKTTDWAAYESSLDRFLAERKERESTAKERGTMNTRLYGLKELYDRYRAYRSLLSSNSALSGAGMAGGNGQAVGAALGGQMAISEVRTALEADLVKAGFPGGITDFEKLIKDYEQAFDRETLAIANVMLDQYAHLLWTEQQRYQNLDVADQLFQSLAKTSARADYQQADTIRSEHAQGVVMSLGEMEDQAYWVGQRNQALARGDSQVRSAASTDPLLSEPDFNRESLARASSKNEVQSIMLSYIASRQKGIEDTRKNLAEKPTMIYSDGLDSLLKASFAAQHIESGSIQEAIIKNHMSDVHWTEAIPQIILAVVAIAAGLLTAGGGTVAVLGAGTALGIGAYQAIEEFRRYERKSAAHDAGLASDDPTMAWVIVAVIGAGFDAAAFLSVLPKLRPAIQAFNAGAEANDVAKLTEKLNKLTDVEEGIRNSIIRGAEAEQEARAAWKAVLHPAVLFSEILPGSGLFGRFVYAVYLSIKRGIREFQVFVKTNEAIELIGDIAKLSPEELAQLKTAYLKAVEEMESVAAHGKGLGMADNDIRAFMNLRGNTKGMSAEQVMQEMDKWAATKASGVPFGFQGADQFEKFQSVASTELKRLLGKADPKAEAFLQGSSLTGVSYKRHLPFDAASDFDVAISSKYLMKQAEKLGYEIKLSPRRIGPLDPDQIAELGLGRFEKRLGAVTEEAAATTSTGAAATDAAAAGTATTAPPAPRQINIMLFDNAEAVTKPIGSASTETERAAKLLKAPK